MEIGNDAYLFIKLQNVECMLLNMFKKLSQDSLI
jgi:hypothetical protein